MLEPSKLTTPLQPMNYWKSFKYKNLTLLFISIVISTFLLRYEPFHTFLLKLGELGYIGAFIAGILFVSTFTVTIGSVILLILAEKLSPVEIGIIAGLGAVAGDYLIFRFVKGDILKEIKPIYEFLGGGHITKLVHTRYFSWTLPLIGAVIIASPLPDEVGVSILGIAKMTTYKFLLLSFALNAVGIFLIVAASTVIKP